MSNSENQVQTITQLLIKEILKSYSNADETLSSASSVAELFIQAVLSHNIFNERKYFENEEEQISDNEFCWALQSVCFLSHDESIHVLKDYIGHNESKKFTLEVPYEYITKAIYDHYEEIDHIKVEERLTILAQVISKSTLSYSFHQTKILEKVFRKFRRHLLLSINQKIYIQKVTQRMSSEASSTALIAQQEAEEARKLSSEAKTLSDESKELSVTSKELSAESKKLSEEAKKIYNDMLVNYITILGIFASIIITVFGGINLANATVKLLQSEYDLPMLVFVVSILMIGFLSILIVLITWISSLQDRSKENKFTKWSILGSFLLFAVGSGYYIYNQIKVVKTCHIGYFTCLYINEDNML